MIVEVDNDTEIVDDSKIIETTIINVDDINYLAKNDEEED